VPRSVPSGPSSSDPERTVQQDLDVQEYTDPEHDPMIPHTLVLKPGLVIHSSYNGYWFWPPRRPRTSARTCARCAASSARTRTSAPPGFARPWDAGDLSPFHGRNNRVPTGSRPCASASRPWADGQEKPCPMARLERQSRQLGPGHDRRARFDLPSSAGSCSPRRRLRARPACMVGPPRSSARSAPETGPEACLDVFFARSAASRQAGNRWLLSQNGLFWLAPQRDTWQEAFGADHSLVAALRAGAGVAVAALVWLMHHQRSAWRWVRKAPLFPTKS
jgi:hypothetical protein